MPEMFSGEAIYETIKESRRIEHKAKALNWEISDVISKSIEELGEFSEASMIKQGKIRNKTMEHMEAPFDEASDVIICLVDALARLYPEKASSEIYCILMYWLNKKCSKWTNKVDGEYEEYVDIS